ncbi:class I SAM-dependent methyltransferase [Solicola sp. PLA-1-18]|uniref:class I SAM-dependent methyltransferase n=1 Tax=Solicola sp. PLA-1-18 TaxID=3380532 RepID=UPI003B75E462
MDDSQMRSTEGEDYARRLQAKQNVWWKKALNVQAPYQWNLRRQELGRTLDVGCGIGRNLKTLAPGSVGVDHNEVAVQAARSTGVTALTVEEFLASEHAKPESFDGMYLAHVIEHMDEADAVEIMQFYLPYLKPGGKVFYVCPQERGYASDPTHVRFVDGEALMDLSRKVGLEPDPWFSFPFPRSLGKAFIYNEFCVRAHKPR